MSELELEVMRLRALAVTLLLQQTELEASNMALRVYLEANGLAGKAFLVLYDRALESRDASMREALAGCGYSQEQIDAWELEVRTHRARRSPGGDAARPRS